MDNEIDREEFVTLAKPLIKFLNDKCNPHAKIIIDTTGAEVFYGEMVFTVDDKKVDQDGNEYIPCPVKPE